MTAVALDSGEREPRTQVSQNRTPANQGEFASFFNNANKQSPKEATRQLLETPGPSGSEALQALLQTISPSEMEHGGIPEAIATEVSVVIEMLDLPDPPAETSVALATSIVDGLPKSRPHGTDLLSPVEDEISSGIPVVIEVGNRPRSRTVDDEETATLAVPIPPAVRLLMHARTELQLPIVEGMVRTSIQIIIPNAVSMVPELGAKPTLVTPTQVPLAATDASIHWTITDADVVAKPTLAAPTQVPLTATDASIIRIIPDVVAKPPDASITRIISDAVPLFSELVAKRVTPTQVPLAVTGASITLSIPSAVFPELVAKPARVPTAALTTASIPDAVLVFPELAKRADVTPTPAPLAETASIAPVEPMPVSSRLGAKRPVTSTPVPPTATVAIPLTTVPVSRLGAKHSVTPTPVHSAAASIPDAKPVFPTPVAKRSVTPTAPVATTVASITRIIPDAVSAFLSPAKDPTPVPVAASAASITTIPDAVPVVSRHVAKRPPVPGIQVSPDAVPVLEPVARDTPVTPTPVPRHLPDAPVFLEPVAKGTPVTTPMLVTATAASITQITPALVAELAPVLPTPFSSFGRSLTPLEKAIQDLISDADDRDDKSNVPGMSAMLPEVRLLSIKHADAPAAIAPIREPQLPVEQTNPSHVHLVIDDGAERVVVTVAVRGSEVNVALRGQDDATTAALARNAGSLDHAMRARGLDLASLMAGRDPESPPQRHPDRGQREPDRDGKQTFSLEELV